MELRRITLADLSLSYLEQGPVDGPLVLVVHGFPDSPYSWEPLISELAAGGRRVIAPFQRGYAPSEVPPAGSSLQTGQLGRDLADLVEALGQSAAVSLVGHDWGALAVYGAAGLLGDRVDAVVGMSVPPGLQALDLLAYDQAKRSFYMWLFQLPVDEMIAAADFEFIERLWDDWSAAGTDTRAAVTAAKDCLRGEGHLSAALGYYRAVFTPDPALQVEQTASETIPSQRFLYLHGNLDGCMGVALSDHVGPRTIVDGANHFIHLDQPEVTARLVGDFLASAHA